MNWFYLDFLVHLLRILRKCYWSIPTTPLASEFFKVLPNSKSFRKKKSLWMTKSFYTFTKVWRPHRDLKKFHLKEKFFLFREFWPSFLQKTFSPTFWDLHWLKPGDRLPRPHDFGLLLYRFCPIPRSKIKILAPYLSNLLLGDEKNSLTLH